ncbi:MAG: rhamnan synthesis F family protein [Clostridiales Family XIII bacterium]|nr:rhamnan synthesis F family protein [Clostridiales Family XIII bacterium]
MNRAAVFVFFDKDGVADAYVDFFLRELSENVQRTVVVVNGYLDGASRAMFEKHAAPGDVLVRENTGFDAWAYKAGLEHIGREAAGAYDEVVIANDTVFGPVYPFREVFSEMEKKPLDFWGLTKHDAYAEEDLVTRNNPYGYAPAHIQSYFVVFRQRLLKSDVFWRFWANLLPIVKYEEAVGKFETILTKQFEDEGFSWDSFVQVEAKATDDPNFTLYCPATLLKECRMPVLKSRVFKQDTLTLNAGEQPRDAFEYVKYHTDYDEDLILASLIRRFDQYDIVKSLALTYILPLAAGPPRGSGKASAALIMHIFYPEMAAEALALAKNMPKPADVYITTDTQKKADAIAAVFRKGRLKPKEIRLTENRGRSESALLIGMRDIILSGQYEVICFWKEKVSKQVDYHASMSWAYKINENLLGSEAYVAHILKTFAENPRLGMLAVPEPFHAVYHWVPGNEWAADFGVTKSLAQRLGLRVPMKEGAPPVTSFGGAFWFRAAALEKLVGYAWQYEHFPCEPLPVDGTLLHAIERIYPFVCQDAGYYPAFAMTDRYAQLEFTNLHNVLQGYVAATLYHGHDFQNHLQAIEYVYDLNARPIRAKAKRIIKRRLPKSLYVCILGAKRVIMGPNRGDALKEIHFRLFRSSYLKRINRDG